MNSTKHFAASTVLVVALAGTLATAAPSPAAGAADRQQVEVHETELAFMSGGSSYDSVSTVDVRLSSRHLPPPYDLARRITWMLTQELGESPRIETVESGAPIVIRPSVVDFSYKDKSARGLARFARGVSLAGGVVSTAMTLRLRIVEARTGEDLESVEGSGKAKSARAELSGRGAWGSTDGLGDTPLGKAAEEAIEAAVESLTERLDSLLESSEG